MLRLPARREAFVVVKRGRRGAALGAPHPQFEAFAVIEHEVARFARLASLFRLILEPDREEDLEVARRLRRLDEWGATTVRPLVLYLLQRRAEGAASDGQIAQAMQYIESFLVRRLLIGRATAALNRILMAAVTEMPSGLPVDEALKLLAQHLPGVVDQASPNGTLQPAS